MLLCIVKLTASDSQEIVDHSTGDVAYLRTTAHTEAKPSAEMNKFSLPPLLEPEFEKNFNFIKNVPKYVSDIPSEPTNLSTASLPPSRLIQIGQGVYATNSISPTISTSIENDIKQCLDMLHCPLSFFYKPLIPVLLQTHNLKTQHIISISLLLRTMSDFSIINPIYASYFASPLPPSRVTISTTIPESVRLSAIISTRPRTGLHVQSRSYWAPANIGPYSQAIAVAPLRNVAYPSTTTAPFWPDKLGLSPLRWNFRRQKPRHWK